jgi:hypothetical protein
VWKGPKEGLSQSLINKFLACPFRFYLYAIRGVEDDRPNNLNLIWGNAFHKGLEKVFEYYLRNPQKDKHPNPEALEYVEPFIKEDLLQHQGETAIPATTLYSILQMIAIYPLPPETGNIEPEQVFEYPFTLPSGREVTYRGKADGIGLGTLVEHKCKGKFDALQTLQETPYDLQTNLYCWVLEAGHVRYDLIRIPEAQYYQPPCPVREKPSDFVYRLFHNHNGKNYPIKRYRKYWIDQLSIPMNRRLILKNVEETIIPLTERIYDWYEYVTQPGFDFEDPKWYNGQFYKTPIRHFDPGKTEYYKCDYWDYLVGDQDLDCLRPVKSFFTELEDE